MPATPTLPELAELYQPVRDDLGEVERIFDDELASELPFIDELCERVRSYRGKMLRPALLLLTAKAIGQCDERAHTLAAVVEMVHMATLVHDDVLDVASERRKQPTVACVEGNIAAVLLGDYLISHAFHLCSSLDSQYASRRVGATTNIVCEGELLQNLHGGDVKISEDDYFDIVRRKTGVLTAVACELGAYAAGARAGVMSAAYAFGQASGIAFQIVDDVLDIVGDPSSVGKTLGQDMLLGKLTLPTIFLMQAGDEDSRALAESMVAGRSVNREQLADRLRLKGCIDDALSVARSYVADAQKHLASLPAGPPRDCLVGMSEFIIRRRL